MIRVLQAWRSRHRSRAHLRLLIQGTEGTIERRKSTDIGRPHITNTLLLVIGDQNELIPFDDAGLPYFPRLVADVQDRTEWAVRQANAFTVMDLVIRAQMRAEDQAA